MSFVKASYCNTTSTDSVDRCASFVSLKKTPNVVYFLEVFENSDVGHYMFRLILEKITGAILLLFWFS
jgi:hypothetical protein